jgi:hypothetical protein
MLAGIGIGDVLIPAFQIQAPAIGQEISRTGGDIEIELESLSNDAAADIGCR